MEKIFILVVFTGILIVGCEKQQPQPIQNTQPIYYGEQAYTLGTYNGNLIAGCEFGTIQGIQTGIVQWNGSSWSNIGSGTDGAVLAQVIYNGNLIIAGGFSHAGGVQANLIAQWNGISWSALGNGINQLSYITGLVVYNGNLFVYNSNNSDLKTMAMWNGAAWQSADSNLNGIINSAIVYNGNLLVGGYFTNSNGVYGIAQYNGTLWSPFSTPFPGNLEISSLAIYNGNLIAGPMYSGGIGQWNGASWSIIDSNLDGCCMLAYNGNLYLGTIVANAPATVNEWNGVKWTKMGVFQAISNSKYGGLSEISAITNYNGSIVISGPVPSSDGLEVYIYNGSTWTQL